MKRENGKSLFMVQKVQLLCMCMVCHNKTQYSSNGKKVSGVAMLEVFGFTAKKQKDVKITAQQLHLLFLFLQLDFFFLLSDNSSLKQKHCLMGVLNKCKIKIY